MKENVILEKSFDFAVRIVHCTDWMKQELKEFDLSRQLLRCGTSIGANVEEGTGAVSRPDFINKMQIAYKEARETHFFLRLLNKTNKLPPQLAQSMITDVDELKRILAAILKSSKD
jgi:four helix bundle protein